MEGSINRRKHTRYSANNGEITVCPEHYGQVENISAGGMKIKLLDVITPLSKSWEMNFFCDSTDTMIKDLPLKLIEEQSPLPPDGNSYEDISIRVKFDALNITHQEQIDRHLNKLSLLVDS